MVCLTVRWDELAVVHVDTQTDRQIPDDCGRQTDKPDKQTGTPRDLEIDIAIHTQRKPRVALIHQDRKMQEIVTGTSESDHKSVLSTCGFEGQSSRECLCRRPPLCGRFESGRLAMHLHTHERAGTSVPAP